MAKISQSLVGYCKLCSVQAPVLEKKWENHAYLEYVILSLLNTQKRGLFLWDCYYPIARTLNIKTRQDGKLVYRLPETYKEDVRNIVLNLHQKTALNWLEGKNIVNDFGKRIIRNFEERYLHV